MHQQFADRLHFQIQFRHAPDLTISERFHAGAANRLGFPHAKFCAKTPDLTSQIATRLKEENLPLNVVELQRKAVS
jgi:hypothetical protein